MKHTKGPWKIEWEEPPFVEYAGWWIRQDNDVSFPIAFVTQTIGGTDPPQEANAHLIAKAPDMEIEIDRLKSINADLLEACKEMLRVFGNPNSTPDQEVDSMTKARQAIAKAEGGKSE